MVINRERRRGGVNPKMHACQQKGKVNQLVERTRERKKEGTRVSLQGRRELLVIGAN